MYEDYNIPSQERVDLLKQLKSQLKAELDLDEVTPAFWACCQFADVSRLKRLSGEDYAGLSGALNAVKPFVSQWNQSAREEQLDPLFDLPGRMIRSKSAKSAQSTRSGTRSGTSSGTKRSWEGLELQRSSTAVQRCKSRDGDRCVLTGSIEPQATHIFPFCLMKKQGQQKNPDVAPFWELMSHFWTKEHVKKWKKSIFKDASKPDVPVDHCDNLICLNAHAHILWNKGLFALKPLKLSVDGKELDIQFFWQPIHNHPDKIDLLHSPKSAEGLVDLGPHIALYYEAKGDSGPKLRSGDHVKLRTENPKEQPLPNWDLLEMQWILQRIVGMCGAADWPASEYDSETEIDTEDELPINEEEEPRYKRIRYHESEFSRPSPRSLDGIFEWIPRPENMWVGPMGDFSVEV